MFMLAMCQSYTELQTCVWQINVDVYASYVSKLDTEVEYCVWEIKVDVSYVLQLCRVGRLHVQSVSHLTTMWPSTSANLLHGHVMDE